MATAITGEMTKQEIEVIIRNHSDYRDDPTLATAKVYIEACEAWLIAPISELEEPRIIQEQQAKAVRWRNGREFYQRRPVCIYPDMTNFRER